MQNALLALKYAQELSVACTGLSWIHVSLAMYANLVRGLMQTCLLYI